MALYIEEFRVATEFTGAIQILVTVSTIWTPGELHSEVKMIQLHIQFEMRYIIILVLHDQLYTGKFELGLDGRVVTNSMDQFEADGPPTSKGFMDLISS